MKNISKTILTGLVAGFISCVLCNQQAQAVSFDYSSTTSHVIDFPGNATFSFVASTNCFMVTTGTATGDLGDITGTYNIGTITDLGGGHLQAPVTGTGTFVIHDGTGHDLSATLTWNNIDQVLAGNTLNVSAGANLTGITYTGTNADLVALRLAGSAANVLTFQFVPPVDLHILRDGPGDHNTSFSGTVATVPDSGSAVALLGMALAGIEGVRRMFRARKS